MTTTELVKLLEAFRAGRVGVDELVRVYQRAPVLELGFATLDVHRAVRCGAPETVFGQGKTTEQIVKIARAIYERQGRVLITRVQPEAATRIRKRLPRAVYHALARCITIQAGPAERKPGVIAVVCAGTSDLPVAEEAAVTAEFLGNTVERVTDVGVAGLHRLLAQLDRLARANVLIVVAGMEGALPSVVAGLTDKPVIAVPTSVGYGASFGGLAALLGMLNSCASGVTVVNIDNGFGAAVAANQINALVARASSASGAHKTNCGKS